MRAPQGDLIRSVRSLPRPAWILFGGTLVNRFGSFVLPFLVLYLRHLGYPVGVAGAAAGAYGLGSVAASAVGGHLADTLGRRGGIALSMFGSAATMLALSQARALAAILSLAVLAGLTAEAYRPASSALLADLVPQTKDRVTAFALYRLAVNLGFAFGPAAAGLLAERSFLFVFLGDAATSALYGTLALVGLPAGHREADGGQGTGGGYRAVVGDRALLLFLAASLLEALVYLQSHSSLSLQVRADGLTASAYGALLSLNGVVCVVLELPIIAVTRRLPGPPTIAAGLLLQGAGFALVAAAHSFATLAGTVGVWTLGEIVTSSVSMAYVASLAPASLHGRYQGSRGLAWGVASVLGPTGGALLFGWSRSGLWLLCGATSAVAAALTLGSGRVAAAGVRRRSRRAPDAAARPGRRCRRGRRGAGRTATGRPPR